MRQELPLVHFSAQREPFLSPKPAILRNQHHMPQTVLTPSKKVDEWQTLA